MNKMLRDKWDRIYQSSLGKLEPAEILIKNQYLLPESGNALDLASGLGANAVTLAQQGLTTQAWDISPVAMQKLQQLAISNALAIKTFTKEITPDCFPAESFDVIVVSRFLDRSICNAIMESLNIGGLLFYQTYTQQKTVAKGPHNPRFLLAENELLALFSSLQLVFYRENADLGNVQQGLRNEAQFIGKKTG